MKLILTLATILMLVGCSGVDYERELIVSQTANARSPQNGFKYTFDQTTIVSLKRFTIGDTLELVKKGSCGEQTNKK
jgi:hypothetical protein